MADYTSDFINYYGSTYTVSWTTQRASTSSIRFSESYNASDITSSTASIYGETNFNEYYSNYFTYNKSTWSFSHYSITETRVTSNSTTSESSTTSYTAGNNIVYLSTSHLYTAREYSKTSETSGSSFSKKETLNTEIQYYKDYDHYLAVPRVDLSTRITTETAYKNEHFSTYFKTMISYDTSTASISVTQLQEPYIETLYETKIMPSGTQSYFSLRSAYLFEQPIYEEYYYYKGQNTPTQGFRNIATYESYYETYMLAGSTLSDDKVIYAYKSSALNHYVSTTNELSQSYSQTIWQNDTNSGLITLYASTSLETSSEKVSTTSSESYQVVLSSYLQQTSDSQTYASTLGRVSEYSTTDLYNVAYYKVANGTETIETIRTSSRYRETSVVSTSTVKSSFSMTANPAVITTSGSYIVRSYLENQFKNYHTYLMNLISSTSETTTE